jgi:hypothetical protein
LNNADRAIALGNPLTSFAHRGSIGWVTGVIADRDLGRVAMDEGRKLGLRKVSVLMQMATTSDSAVLHAKARVPIDISRVPIDAGIRPSDHRGASVQRRITVGPDEAYKEGLIRRIWCSRDTLLVLCQHTGFYRRKDGSGAAAHPYGFLSTPEHC